MLDKLPSVVTIATFSALCMTVKGQSVSRDVDILRLPDKGAIIFDPATATVEFLKNDTVTKVARRSAERDKQSFACKSIGKSVADRNLLSEQQTANLRSPYVCRYWGPIWGPQEDKSQYDQLVVPHQWRRWRDSNYRYGVKEQLSCSEMTGFQS